MKLTKKTFREWVLGVLVYMVVLSLFDDYTDFVFITSASTILMASLVLQALMSWTLDFEKWIGSKFKYPEGTKFKPAKFFAVWAVLFLSKFVFLWVIDILFGENVEFSGFVALILVIVSMIIVKEIIYLVDSKLPEK